MAWIEWHGNVLPTSDDEANFRCAIQPPHSIARRQCWSFSLDHFVRNPEIKANHGLVLALYIELENLGFQVDDWRHIGRQAIVATPDWHARAETLSPYGHLASTCLTVNVMEPDAATGQLQWCEWLADYYRITFSPPTGTRFPCELDAWCLHEEEFRAGGPLQGEEIRRIPTGPPNLRAIALARFESGRIVIEGGHPDPAATARRRLAELLALDDAGPMFLNWWATTERKNRNLDLPPPPSELRLCDVTFRPSDD